VRQSRALEVGVDLFDDRVATVGLVRGDGVECVGRGGGEERVEAPQVEQGVVTGGAVASALTSGILRTTSRPGTCSAFFCRAKRDERDLGAGDHLPVASS
jgi:hypothetical protein